MYELWLIGGSVLGAGVVAISSFKVFKAAPYAYSNAKIRALKSDLVTDEELLKYSDQDYNEVIYEISKKEGFKYFVGATKGELNIESVEAALRANLSRIIRKVYDLSPVDTKKYLKTYLLLDELKNIQTFFRFQKGILEGASSNPLMLTNLLTATRKFSKEEWHKMIKLPLKDFVNKFRGEPYHALLVKHVKQLNNDNYDFDLNALNKDIDQFYFNSLKKVATNQASKTNARMVIDNYNIRRAFNYLKFQPYKGGFLNEEFFEGIDSFEKLKSVLLKSRYKKLVEEAKDEEELEFLFEKGLKQLGSSFMKKDPLSANSIVGFMTLKLYEIKNLRALLILKNSGFSPEEIKENLIINAE